ncbi:MAG: cyclase family protein [Clostridiales bacterium]|nr:cyclase family protein [Clostridiales bacterium]
MKYVDLSIALEPDLPSDPPELTPRFKFFDHTDGIEMMKRAFGCEAEALPKEGLSAITIITCSDHSGTHMDAPFHYSPVTDDGKPMGSIDTLPLEWCFADGVCVHFQDKPDGYLVMPEDLEEYFADVGYTLKAGDIVLLHTSADARHGSERYIVSGCGVGRAATLWLVNQGVNIVGTDAWSWDRPLPLIAEDYSKSHDASIIWEGHLAGKTAPYFQMEKMTNLDRLPPFGFRLICVPIKIKGGTAGWVRPIAILP